MARNLENPDENRVHKDCAIEGKTGKLFVIDVDVDVDDDDHDDEEEEVGTRSAELRL